MSEKIYEGKFVLTSYFFYYTCTLHVEGAKTFYGKAGGLGSPGKGKFSGPLHVYVDDINDLYEKGTAFVAMTTPVIVAVAFVNLPLDTMAKFAGAGIGSISATITGGGHWE